MHFHLEKVRELLVVICIAPALILMITSTTQMTGYREAPDDNYQEMTSDYNYQEMTSDYNYQEMTSDYNYQEMTSDYNYKDITSDYNYTEKLPEGFFRQGRWGIFFTYEPVCTLACRKNGKFSGRMYGGVCRCYCPRLERDPCAGNTYPSCDRYCRQNNYQLGGDCLDGTNCYCYCTVRQRQSANGTTTTPPPPCGPEAATSSTGPPPEESTQSAPSPGTLGINQGGGTMKRNKQRRRQGPRIPRT